MTYDASRTRAYFDAFGEREWSRLEATLQGRVKYEIHRRFLERHIRPGMRVLDVGAGPGRFAIDIARAGARVTVVDLSPVQLELARKQIAAHGVAAAVDGFHELDILDLSSLESSAYDVVVCFGGAISYTVTRHVDALRELARVATPGGPIVVSVMSLLGTLRLLGPLDAASVLETIDEHLDLDAVVRGDDIVYTHPGSREFHQPLALFTRAGLNAAFNAAGLAATSFATSDPLLPEFQQIPRISASPQATERLLALEVALASEPGLIEAGAHMLATATHVSG